jgi:hypothetical protein
MRRRPKKISTGSSGGQPNSQDPTKEPVFDAEFEALRAVALPVTQDLVRRIDDLAGDIEVNLDEALKREDD